MRHRTRRLSACRTALLSTFAVLGLPLAGLAQPPSVTSSPDASAEFQALMETYYRAYCAKDLAAMSALWHPNGPARAVRNIVELEFELRDTVFKGVRLSGVSVDPGGGRARAVVDLEVTDRKTGRSRSERHVRDLTFLQDGAEWKLWNEASAAMSLAQRILSVPDSELPAVLAAEPELLSDDALNGLANAGSRFRTPGGTKRTLLELRLQVARAAGNDLVVARCLVNQGLADQLGGRIPEAGKAFREAREMYARAGTDRDLAMADLNIGSVDYLEGRYADAVQRYEAASAFFESAKDLTLAASTRHSVGNCLYMLGEFERALEAYSEALTANEEAGNQRGVAAVHLAMALVHKDLGNYDPSADAYGRSAASSEASGDLNGAAKALHGVGEVRRIQGDFASALAAFQASLARWEKTTDTPNRAASLFSIGQVYAQQRSFTLAIDYYKRALELDESVSETRGIARDLGGLGGAHFAVGEADTALAEYEKSLTLREKSNDGAGVVWTLIHMGVVHASQARPDEAIRLYQRAIGGASTQGDRAALATAWALTGSARLAGGDIEGALEASGRASELASQVECWDVLAYSRTVTGKAHKRAERPAEALAALKEAVSALGRVPVGPGAETFFDDRRGPYLALVDLLVAQDDAVEAYAWLERGRHHGVAAMLGGDGSVVTRGLSVEDRDEERRLLRGIRAASAKLSRERARARPDESRRAALQGELASLNSQLAALRERIYAANPRLADLRAQGSAVTAETAGRLLGPRDAVLAFAVDEAKTYAFVVSPAAAVAEGEPAVPPRVDVVAIEKKATELAVAAARFRESLATRDEAAEAISRELHEALIKPVRAFIAHRQHLIIVPDAFLWGVPFEALRSESGRYLIEDSAVSYVPSLSALAASGGEGGLAARARFLAVTAPAVAKAAGERFGLLRPGVELDRGVAGRREASSIASLFGPARSTVVAGAAATPARVASGVPSGGALHVACPFLLSDASPFHSPLLLSPSRPDDSDAGLVELGAVLGWEVPAGLAFFSMAENAPGGVTGEALGGLSWTLMVAGTPTVAASRWAPAATSGPARTDPLVRGFYRALVRGAAAGKAPISPAVALRQAARSMLAAPSTRHPHYWARFIVVGK